MPLLVDAPLRATTRSTDLTPRSVWMARVGVLVASSVLFVWNAGERGLWSAHEGRVAQNALNILEQGDWLIPRLHTGEAETQKPPLYYWLAAASSAVWGSVDGWSIRLPSLVAAVVCLLLVFEFGLAVGGIGLAITATTILGCTTRFAWLARVARVDMALGAAVVGCLFLFWRSRVQNAHHNRPTPLPIAFYGLLALAVMLKGPIALMLVGTPILLWLAFSRRPLVPGLQQGAWREWQALRLPTGLLTLVGLGGAWFLYANTRLGGKLVEEFFVEQNLGRLFGTGESFNASPFWTYGPRFFVDFFPWSVLFLLAVRHFWRVRETLRRSAAGPTMLFLVCWLTAPLVFLSMASCKRGDYLLPIYPAAALFVGCWLEDRRRRFLLRRQTSVAFDYQSRSRWIVVTAFGMAAIAVSLLFWGERQFARKGGLAKTILNSSVLDQHLNDTDEFILLRLESILREHWPLLGILLPALAVAVWMMHTGWHERFNRRLVAGLAVPWAVCFLVQVQIVMPRIDAHRDMERFAQTIRHLAGRGQTIYYFDELDADLVFHAGKPAALVDDWAQMIELGRRPTPVFVVLRAHEWKRRSKDPDFAVWREVANNCQFSRHREPRSLVTNHVDDIADRLRSAPTFFLR